MASVTSVVTIDTGEWKYPDVYGVEHTVTNAQAFSIVIENTASNIKWQVAAEAPSLHASEVNTDDGYKIRFRPLTDGNNSPHQLMVMAIADTTLSYVVPGEWRIQCPVSGIIQIWKFAQFYASNVDCNAAGTLGANTKATACKLEDQFGNVMWLPAGLVAGITMAQAA